jgi:hypothetical protein
VNTVGTERRLELGRPHIIDESAGQQEEHVGRVKPPQCKRQRTRRGRVEPLDIVDCDHDRLAIAKSFKCTAHRHGKRSAVDRIA